MSQAAVTHSSSNSIKQLVADSFSRSVVLLGCLVIVQRGIGFLRSFYVCGFLSPAEVGRWDLAFSFLAIVAPLAVFGIPGSFGRYVARYEANGQQHRFLTRTLLACIGLTCVASVTVWLFDSAVAKYFFGTATDAPLVRVLAIGLPLVVFFNFATSWFTGKRLTRLVFRIQFAQTLFFACLCVMAFQLYSVSAVAVVVAYLVSCLVGICLAGSYALIDRDSSPNEFEPSEPLEIWRKILPFAVWVWISNALFNLFVICDRMLLVNFYPDKTADIQSLIGQYHTACIFPLLLMSLGAMAGSMLIPYLSKDWEAGEHQSVNDRLNLMIKGIGLLCLTASVGILLIAPFMFGRIWQDKFAMGESLLPATLCYCSFAAMTFVAQKYFWCIEKTWFSSVLLLIGLIANFTVGLMLIGPFGIHGVVASTLIANALVLVGVLLLCRRHELQIERGVYITGIALLAICFGKLFTALAFVALVLITVFTPWLFDESQKQMAISKAIAMRNSLLGSAS